MVNEALIPSRRLDPLRRVFIPREVQGVFRTHDHEIYRRDRQTGSIRKVTPKVKGKAARRAERKARRLARERGA